MRRFQKRLAERIEKFNGYELRMFEQAAAALAEHDEATAAYYTHRAHDHYAWRAAELRARAPRLYISYELKLARRLSKKEGGKFCAWAKAVVERVQFLRGIGDYAAARHALQCRLGA